jgi:DNA-binding NtrC family response regulator
VFVNVAKRILVVAHDQPLRESRVNLLQGEGYCVQAVETDDEAMVTVQNEPFDLILLGRKSRLLEKGIDQRLREKYPELLILKIESASEPSSVYPSRITDPAPRHVLEALHKMLGDGVRLEPFEPGS